MAHDTDSYPGMSSNRSARPESDSDADEADGSDPSSTEEGYVRIGSHAFDAESLEIYHRSDVSDKDYGYVAVADHATTSPWTIGNDRFLDEEFKRDRAPGEVGWFYPDEEHTDPSQDVLDEYLVENHEYGP